MKELKEAIEKINKAFSEFREANDSRLAEIEKKGAPDPLTTAAVEKANAEIGELRKTIETLQTHANRPGFSTATPDDPQKALQKRAFEKFIRYGDGENGRSQLTEDELREVRALSDPEGGFLVPPEFDAQIIRNAYDMAEIRPLANAMPTGRDTVHFGSIAKPTVAWGRSGVAITSQELAAGGATMEIMSVRGLYLMHNDTLEDPDADVLGEVEAAFGLAIAEAEDDAFITGTGADQPQGVLVYATVLANSVVSGVADALTDSTHNGVDAIISLLYKVKKAYRRNGAFAMNSSTESLVRKMKDSDGQYLWQPPVQADRPATLLGRPVINPEGMPDVAANAYAILFGDWKTGYRIRDRTGITVKRLVERYAEYDQTGVIVKRRVGGMVVLPEAFAVLKIAAS